MFGIVEQDHKEMAWAFFLIPAVGISVILWFNFFIVTAKKMGPENLSDDLQKILTIFRSVIIGLFFILMTGGSLFFKVIFIDQSPEPPSMPFAVKFVLIFTFLMGLGFMIHAMKLRDERRAAKQQASAPAQVASVSSQNKNASTTHERKSPSSGQPVPKLSPDELRALAKKKAK